MQVLSQDQYYISGVQKIVSDSGLNPDTDITVVDPGHGVIYITRSSDFVDLDTTNMITNFMNIRCYTLKRNSTLEDYIYTLKHVEKVLFFPRHARPLSARELAVMNFYLTGFEKRTIMRIMSLSDRALSFYQNRALRKMNIKTVPLFLKVMRNLQSFSKTNTLS